VAETLGLSGVYNLDTGYRDARSNAVVSEAEESLIKEWMQDRKEKIKRPMHQQSLGGELVLCPEHQKQKEKQVRHPEDL
jgi:hypothetical protein